MNKQIKELVLRAEALTEQEWHRLAQSTDGMPAYRDLFNQKFAELIVRECAEVGHDSVEDGDDIDAIMRRVHNNILKHFGV